MTTTTRGLNDVTPEEWDAVRPEAIRAKEKAMASTTEVLDIQVGGDHYRQGGVQPIEFITSNNIEFREANIIKYVFRHSNKNGVEDLKKAQHYLNMLIGDYK